jgi:hypothetical protein
MSELKFGGLGPDFGNTHGLIAPSSVSITTEWTTFSSSQIQMSPSCKAKGPMTVILL